MTGGHETVNRVPSTTRSVRLLHTNKKLPARGTTLFPRKNHCVGGDLHLKC